MDGRSGAPTKVDMQASAPAERSASSRMAEVQIQRQQVPDSAHSGRSTLAAGTGLHTPHLPLAIPAAVKRLAVKVSSAKGADIPSC